MPHRPNVLFLMCDQMQGRVLDPAHPCRTPNLDRLASRGLRFTRAYTSNAVCSPARAGIMTGLLPHNHGVIEVTHTVDEDQSRLRRDKPHWASRLAAAGWRTGYFGKWHVDRAEEVTPYGWQVDGSMGSPRWVEAWNARGEDGKVRLGEPRYDCTNPPGYRPTTLYGVTETPPERLQMGIVTQMAGEFLDEVLGGADPWCCFVSLKEPHDPFICGREAFERYDVDAIELPPNVVAEGGDVPNVYRKLARTWEDMSQRQRREAVACYYAIVSELDAQLGRLLDRLAGAGELDNTLIVLTADHGELLGAHGLYCKNVSAFEEIYNVPLIVAGPGVAAGVTAARVGTHDLCPTLLDVLGLEPIDVPDSRSFAPVLADPAAAADYTHGYAEYFGSRYKLTQRIVWDGPWKLVHNGFDFDELYNLDADPYELENLAADPAHEERLHRMFEILWTRVRDTNDRTLWNSHYPGLRLAPWGPSIAAE